MEQHCQPPRPASDATSFLDRFCSIVSVSSIPHANQACPICSTQYCDPTAEDGPDSQGLALQVNFGECHHIFCTLCLRELVLGQEAWSNKCPLCRAHWIRSIEDIERERMVGISIAIQSHVGRQRGRRAEETRRREPAGRPWIFVTPAEVRRPRVIGEVRAVVRRNAISQHVEWRPRLADRS